VPSDLPNWIQAVATILALVVAAIAVFPAWKAYLGERRRDERAHAIGVSAWWGKYDDKVGVMISNSQASLIRRVVMKVVANDYETTHELAFLPQGDFFIESRRGTARPTWEFPERVSSGDPLPTPLSKSKHRHRIISLHFVDADNSTWNWSPQDGLVREKITPAR